ncbi:hypothetical protein BDV97DRAFT_214744 [Delphinella strobiligena]|nr:hypothetical protein BDV97DRAFT_214744 [Delphinella strobiligena]
MEIQKKREADDDGRRPTKTAKSEQWVEASRTGTFCEGEDISVRAIPKAPFPSPFVSQDGPITRAKSKAWNVFKLNRNNSGRAVRRLYDSYKCVDIDVLISAIHLNGFGQSKEKEAPSSDYRDRGILLLDVDSSSSDPCDIEYPKYGDFLDAYV